MAGTLYLRPSAVYPYGRGSWGYFGGATSLVNAVNEAVTNDTTYIRLNSNYTGSGAGASIKFKTTPQQLPGGAKARYMRAVVRAKTTDVNNEVNFRLLIQNIRAGNPSGVNYVKYDQQLAASSAFKTINNPIDVSTKSNNKVYDGGVIDQTSINNLVVEIFDVVSANMQFSQLWIEVAYDEKPVVVLDDLGIVNNTTSPNITWSYTDDLEPQAAIDLQILNNSGTVIYEVSKKSNTDAYFSLPITLTNGTYTARVRAYQNWTYTGDAPVSDWDESTFTIDIGTPANPSLISVSPQSDLARTKISAQHNLNLLGEGVAEAEVASWESITNANLYSGSTVVFTGDRSLITEIIANGNATVRAVPLTPVSANTAYGFTFRFRPYPGDTAVNVQAGIRWLDSTGTLISDTVSANILEQASIWKLATITGTAPANAVYAKPFINWISGIAGDWHYVDAPMFAALPTTGSATPLWSRGGFAFNTPNLIAYGDSSLEANSHWEADNASTNVAVVNTATEITDLYAYQGDNSLKVETTGSLARRDNETFISSSATSIVINKGDVVEGDFMLAFIEINSTTPTITPPSGWTTVNTQDVGTTLRTAVYSKVATASEPSTYTWTLSASAKAAGLITSYDGVASVFANTKASVSTSATVFNMPASTYPHNAYVVEAVLGIRGAATVGATWTTNMSGANYDAQLSSIANTANEIAFGVYSKKYSSGVTTATAVSGNTLTSSATLTSAVTYTVVLAPTKTTARATLANYQYYDIDTTKDYVAFAAVFGADSITPNSANRQITMIIDVFDNNKVLLTSYNAAQTTASVGSWKKFSAVLNMTDDPLAKYASIRLEVDQMTDAERYYFDSISFYQSSVNLGYAEGKKVIDGPYIEFEQSEDNGVTWKSFLVEPLTDATKYSLDVYDYEIASGITRRYRAFNWKNEDGNLLRSTYSNDLGATVTLQRIWMHIQNDPEGTIYNFIYDGGGRDESFNKESTDLQFAGREYPQAHFGAGSTQSITGTIQLPNKEDVDALRSLNKTRALVIFRDQRGRRVLGKLDVRVTDVVWGNTASFTITVLGVQP